MELGYGQSSSMHAEGSQYSYETSDSFSNDQNAPLRFGQSSS